MPAVRAQVVLRGNTGVPEDVIVNTFHFRYASTLSAVGDAIRDALRDFYDNPDATTQRSVSHFLGAQISRTGAEIKLYDLDAIPTGPPDQTHTLNLDAPAVATSLPEEVALCMSYQGVPNPPQPQAQRRGRIYLGPLTTECSANVAGIPRPATIFLDTVAAAADRLVTASKGANGWAWVVYSAAYAGRGVIPRTNKPDLPAIAARNASWVDVDNGWVDNSFDTQRRRGRKATSRTLFAQVALVAMVFGAGNGDGLAITQLVMSTLQTCFLAYLAARYRTPWDIPIDAPRKRTKRSGADG